MNEKSSPERLKEFFEAGEEWLAVEASGKSFAVRRGEIEISANGGKILLEFPGEKGFAAWRVKAWEIEGQKIIFDLSARFGRDKKRISFVPRVRAAELSAAVEAARIEKANKIAALVVACEPGAKLLRVGLNKSGGRIAEIVFESRTKTRAAALADVSDALAPEALLTTALLRLENLRRRKKKSIGEIHIAAEAKTSAKLQKLAALLRPARRSGVKVLALANDRIEELPILERRHFSKGKSHGFSAVEDREASDLAARIASLASREADTIRARGGETVRFRGLPFLRVRKMPGAEKAWFGVEGERRLLTAENFGELVELIEDLKIYRRFDSPNKRHALYRLAPEAWLESVLRRDIRRLDANLILSPVYNQFRVSNEQIDLLAARRDGRLVVVEVKTAPDREMVFQAADYWREIEAQNRAGVFERNKIFGELKILKAPPLVYLAAPALSFHPDSAFFARQLIEEIEIFRFDLNENWRERLKVLSRRSLTEKL